MPRRIVAEVYEPDGTTLVRELTADRGRSWLEDLSDTGSWQIDEAVLDHDDSAALTEGRIVRFLVDGTARWQGLVEPVNQTSAGADRQGSRIVGPKGRGCLALLERVHLYPELGVGRVSPPNRYFNPASLDYNDASWDDPVELKQQDDDADPWSGAPAAWPDGLAKWIGATGDDTVPTSASVRWFRNEFIVPVGEAGEYRFFLTADDGFTPYLDGDRQPGEAAAGLWGETKTFDAYLEEGNHVFACRAVNFDRPDPMLNVFGFIMTCRKLNSGGLDYGDVLFRSETAGWKMLADPATEPGMTPGRIIKICMDEAHARGTIPEVNYSFTGSLDSSGNLWPIEIDVAFPVGTNLLEIVQKLVSEGVVEVSFDPETMEVHAWPVKGADLSGSVALVLGPDAGANIAKMQHQRTPAGPNAALAKTDDDKYIEVEDAAAATAYGRRESYLSLGGAPTTTAGERQANAYVAARANPTELITSSQIEVVPGGPTPWVDYNVGDVVTAPAMDESAAMYRLRALAIEEDAAGNPIFMPELGDRLLRSPFDRMGRAFTAMNPGAAWGSFESIAPVQNKNKLRTEPSVNGDDLAVFSGDGLWSTLDTVSPPWPLDAGGDLYEVAVAFNAAPTDALTFAIDVNGVEVDSITVPSGNGYPSTYTVAAGPADTVAGDQVTIRKVSGGTSANDPTIKVRFRSNVGPRGPVGPPGPTGPDGPQGLSAYEVAVEDGFVGDETAWLATLEGPAGPAGEGVPAGGLTGHALLKASNADYDTEWGVVALGDKVDNIEHGTTIGEASEGVHEPYGPLVILTVFTTWGITSLGVPYYDSAGAVSGEEAILEVTSTGTYRLSSMEVS